MQRDALEAENLRRKWESSILDDEGVVKDTFRYQNARLQPIRKGLTVVCIRGVDEKASGWRLDKLLAGFNAIAESEHVQVVVYAWDGYKKKLAKKNRSISFRGHDDASKPELLAVAESICVAGFLPNYFYSREGQRVVQVWSKLKDVKEPTHLVLSKQFVSQLLNTTSIVASSDLDVREAMSEFHMEGLYSGALLNWRSAGEYERALSEHVCTGGIDGFQPVKLKNDKKKLLLYFKMNENEQYSRLASRIVHSLDFDVNDLTLLLDRAPTKAADVEALNEFPKSVRVISRGGILALPADDYVDVQVALRQIKKSDCYAEWLNAIDEGRMKDEGLRLIGSSTFDTFLYCGESNPLWYLISNSIDAKKKCKVEHMDMHVSSETRSFPIPAKMEREANAYVFDLMCYEGSLDIASKEMATSNMPSLAFELPFDIERANRGFGSVVNATLGDDAYAFFEESDDGLTKTGVLVRMPKPEAQSYLVVLPENDIASVLEEIAKRESGGWECVILGDFSESAVLDWLDDYPEITTVSPVLPQLGYCNGSLLEYVKLFSKLVTSVDYKYDVFKASASAVNVDVLYATDSGLEQAVDCAVYTEEDALRINRAELNRVIA